nr:PREDICTED: putative inositol monophosphatase 3 isoform X2 [Tribolium castaneum]|eukprot:XP_015833558.1 PREDICTED: putative inositol monophosphatase 3 isoform X2 [Tribolium castaneum]
MNLLFDIGKKCTMVCVAVKGEPVIGVIHGAFNTEAYKFWAWVGKVKSPNLKYARNKSENIDNKLNVPTGEIKKVLREKVKIVDIIEVAGYKALEVVLDNVEAYLPTPSIKKCDICAENAIIKAVVGKKTTKFKKLIDYKDDSCHKNAKCLVVTVTNQDMFFRKF